MMRNRYSKILLALPALIIGTGALQATTTLAAPSVTTLALTCDTVFGPGASQQVGIKLASGSTALTVAVTAVNGSTVLANGGGILLPSSASVTSSTVNTNFTIVANPGCKGASFGTNSITLTFTPPSPGSAVTVAATLTVTANGGTTNATALAPSPSSVNLTCTKTGTTYSNESSQVVNVMSAAPSGTPFTVDTTALDPNALPAWLSVTPTSGGTANIAGVPLTFTTAANCGSLPVGTTSFNVHLLNAPAPDKVVPVSVQVGAASTLTATPSAVTIAYAKGDTYANDAQSTVISTSSTAFYSVDQTTLPLWLNVSAGASGTPTGSGTTVTLTFVPTAGAQTLSPGVYTAAVHLKVSGQLDTVVTVNMQLSNAAPSLTIGEGTGARTVNWVFGSAVPTGLVITPVSSDSPIPFTVTTTAGTLNPQVSITSGLAYSFGTPIQVTFLQSVFAAYTLGMTAPTGTVTIHYGTNSHIDIVLTLNIVSPAATITALSPSTVAPATSGSFPLALTGSGFQSGTVVGIVSNGLIVPDSNIAANVVNSTTIVLTVTVPGSADPLMPLGAPGQITIGVCNPGGGGNCSTPTGTAVLKIGVNPIIQAVTSASSYAEVTPPALQQVAPYDILSIFGTNFCVSNATGCVSPNPAIMYGKTDPVTLRYLTSLSPDTTGNIRNLTVAFNQHSSAGTLIATAPLLFATNGQINMIVPSEVSTFVGQAVDIVVSFGYGASGQSTLLQSTPYTVLIAASDPGVFTSSGDGQGQAAALQNSTGALLTQSAPAVARSTATDSDIVQLYVTGLGAPDSDGSTAEAYPNNTVTCMSVAGFYGAVNSATSSTLTSADGLVLQHTLFTSGQIEPCLTVAAAPSVTIGGVAASVLFAGWVSDSVAGLYQIDVQLPTTTSNTFTDASGTTAALAGTARNLPVVVSMPNSGPSSQASGVNIWAIRGLKMATTGTTTVSGVITVAQAHTAAVSGLAVVASEGTSTYTYSVLSGTLPTGLTLNANGTITGTPAAGNVTVVFQAVDSTSGTPLSGTISINFNIS